MLNFALQIIAIFLICHLYEVISTSSSASRKVYFHIGPCKTGTSYIQAYFAKLHTWLESHGLCWPGKPHMSAFIEVAEAMDRGEPVPQFHANIQKCFDRGLDVVVSSEFFVTARNISNIIEEMKRYHVHLIAYHREPVTLHYSGYTQGQKISTSPMPVQFSFIQLLSVFDINYNSITRINQIRRYFQAFGELTIVDYDGVLAAGKDIAEVIISDIIKLPTLPRGISISELNTKPDMVAYDVMAHVHNFIKVLGCKFTAYDNKTFAKEMGSYYTRVIESSPALFPISIKKLKNLRGWSETVSLAYRKEFQNYIIYNNHSATMAAFDRFSLKHLNVNAFYQCLECMTWLRAEVRRLVAAGKVGHCTEQLPSL